MASEPRDGKIEAATRRLGPVLARPVRHRYTVKVFWIYVLVLLSGLLVVAFFPAITLVAPKLVPVS